MYLPNQSDVIRITANYQNLKRVIEIFQVATPRVIEVLDTNGDGLVFSVFDQFSGFNQLTILLNPQRTVGLGNIQVYLDVAVGSDDSPTNHVEILAAFFACLYFHKLELCPNKFRVGAAHVDFFCDVICRDGFHPNDTKVAALTRMPMPTEIQQLFSLLGRLNYCRKFLPNMARRILPILVPLKKNARFDFNPAIEEVVRALHAELAAPSILVFSDSETLIAKSRTFCLHWDASTDGREATLEQEQPDGPIRPIVYISRGTLDNEQDWTPVELKARCVAWSIQ